MCHFVHPDLGIEKEEATEATGVLFLKKDVEATGAY